MLPLELIDIINTFLRFETLRRIYSYTYYNWYKCVFELKAYDKTITNDSLKKLVNLRELRCEGNTNFTDDGLKHLVNLIYLNCGCNRNFTGECLKYLVNLETINYGCNQNLKHLYYLCQYNLEISIRYE